MFWDRFLRVRFGRQNTNIHPCNQSSIKPCLSVLIFHGVRSSNVNHTRVQSHINNGFFKLVEAFLQIQSCLFSHSIKLRVLPLSAVTISLHYLPRCLLLRSEIPSGTCAELLTVAASNNRDHPTRSLYYCLFAPHTYICVLRAHPVRRESHNQRNTTGEVATLR